MNQAEYKQYAEALIKQSHTSISFQGQQNLLLEAQVYATLATIPDEPVWVNTVPETGVR